MSIPTTRLAETAGWLDALYGRCRADDGYLVVVASSRRSVLSVHPLGDGRHLVEAAKSMQGHPGCYAKINPMDYRAMHARARETGRPVVGKQSEVRSIVAMFADVDAGKGEKYVSRSHALWAIRQMPLRPTMIVNSATGGGLHVYWLLNKPHRIQGKSNRERIAELSRRWQERLRELLGGKLDNTSNLDRVLRCVGVPRLDGDLVSCEEADFRAAYRMEDFG